MTNVKCSAVSCGFNKDRYCNKQNLKVEGLFSRSKLGTFCQSFKNIGDQAYNAEFALEQINNVNQESNEVSIGCSANYCVFNDGNYCHAKEIKVGSPNAKYRSETQCDSFKLR